MRLENSPTSNEEFEKYLELATEGVLISETGLPDSVQVILETIILSGASPELIASARLAFKNL